MLYEDGTKLGRILEFLPAAPAWRAEAEAAKGRLFGVAANVRLLFPEHLPGVTLNAITPSGGAPHHHAGAVTRW